MCCRASALVFGVLTLLPCEALARVASERETTKLYPYSADRSRGRSMAEATAPGALPKTERGSLADARRYAEKQAQSKGAQRFRAGDDVVVVVGASTITLVLAIVLLVILL